MTAYSNNSGNQAPFPLPSVVYNGQQAATGTAAALSAQILTNSIAIVALSSNTGTVYVGGVGVTTGTGYPLAPGQAIGYTIANANAVYIVGTGTVAWTGN